VLLDPVYRCFIPYARNTYGSLPSGRLGPRSIRVPVQSLDPLPRAAHCVKLAGRVELGSTTESARARHPPRRRVLAGHSQGAAGPGLGLIWCTCP